MRAVLRLVASSWLALSLGLAGLWAPSFVQAAPPANPAEARLAAQLAAGEFAPALRDADGQADPQRRDFWLGQVALAQRGVGDQSGYVSTLGKIASDGTRTATMAAEPPQLGRMGGSQADFDTLIDLIVTTIAPDSWDEVGGPGSISPFPTGVFIDADGLMRRSEPKDAGVELVALRSNAFTPRAQAADPRRQSALRKVSLPRLERHLQLLAAQGRKPDETAAVLAGVSKVQYVFVCPETRDLVIAGPAGNWTTDPEGRIVNADSGRPVLRLDDLIVLLRHFTLGDGAPIGCAIEPEQQGLADLQAYIEKTGQRSLRPGERASWAKGLREALGRQRIDIFGVSPTTRVAQVLVEADYRMKLVGMGLEPGTPDVPSYLQLIDVPRGGSPPPLTVLRWWFALAEKQLEATNERDAWRFPAGSVRVLSENELLAELGRRVHTGQSDPLNLEFARNFTTHFDDLAVKYPVYAELENVFDLSLVAAAIRTHGLAAQVGWSLTGFGDAKRLVLPETAAPKSVESVVNHRVIRKVHVVAGVSGGVSLDPRGRVQADALKAGDYGALTAERQTAAKAAPPAADRWWWD
ncbi:MAG: DUF1598 domain-containing protein [Pirellulales bacterium]